MASLSGNNINVKISTTADTSGVNETERSLHNLGERGSAVSGIMRGAVVAGFAAATAGAVAVGAAAIKSISAFADFQQSMNVLGAVSGATGAQLSQMKDISKQLGKDITLPGVSAKDAALAMVELAKAGLSVNDTMAASKGVLSLAKAGQVDTAFAAEVTANALNAFSLSGKEANHVADMLAGGANGSSASIQDLALGMQMASAGAATLKMPVNDLITALGLMSNNGIKGSDAGTSLKTMMINLIPTTDAAVAAFQAMNLHFFDAKGNFIGLREAAKQLQEGTKGMTDQQKMFNMQQAFGTDSSRAAIILAKEGAAGYDKMTAAVTKQGAATDLAAAQNSGLKGAFENIRSIVETLSITIGEKLAPYVQRLADYLAAHLEPAARQMYERFKEMWPAIKAVAEIILSLTEFLLRHREILAIVAGVIGGFMVAAFVSWAAAATVAAIATIAATWPFLALGAVVGLVAYEIVTHWEVLKNAFMIGYNFIASIINAINNYVRSLPQPFREIIGVIGAVLSGVGGMILSPFRWAYDSIVGLFRNLPGTLGSIVSGAFGVVGSAAKSVLHGLHIPGFATGVQNFSGGLALVGEQGPELVNLPKGSSVYTNGQSQQMMGGSSSSTYNIAAVNLTTADATRAFFEIQDRNGVLASKGLSIARGF